ncbi:MAG: fluoride efflux transporter CrcB [Nocardioidaceae bacterium]
MAFLFVCLGAAVGAPARYLTDKAVAARHDSVLPWGTLVVNVVASLVLGVLVGLSVRHQVPDPVTLAVGTGFCGALSTYSTFSYETLRLVEEGAWPYALGNVLGSLGVGLAAAVVGYLLGVAA